MNWIENLLILVGISLDIFAGMECQGSLVAKIDKKHLTLVCGLIAIWQLAALYIGNVLADYFISMILPEMSVLLELSLQRLFSSAWVSD